MSTTPRPSPATRAMPTHGHGYVVVVTALTGIVMLAPGLWALLAPRSFADFVAFPYHEHFLHDRPGPGWPRPGCGRPRSHLTDHRRRTDPATAPESTRWLIESAQDGISHASDRSRLPRVVRSRQIRPRLRQISSLSSVS